MASRKNGSALNLAIRRRSTLLRPPAPAALAASADQSSSGTRTYLMAVWFAGSRATAVSFVLSALAATLAVSAHPTLTEHTVSLPHPTSATATSSGSWRVDLAMTDVGTAVTTLGESLLDYTVDPDDVVPALHLLGGLRKLRQRLAMAEAVVEAQCAAGMTTDRVEAPGLLAERRGGAKRTAWRHDDVRASIRDTVAVRAAVDQTTGEVDPVRADAATHAVDLALSAVGAGSYRASGLRALGLDPGNFCTQEYGRRTVAVTLGADSVVDSE